MNTPGMTSYSKETVGLRQPIQIKDQHFKLVYAYPILVVDILNQREIKNDIRSFLSISFLREIFVSNSLNIIQMASQIPAITQRNTDVAQLIGNAVLSSSGTVNTNNVGNAYNSYNDTNASYQLQSRVETKTKQIVKYLLSDTRTKKLQPQIEIITLNNLIDVPVIVGTKDYNIPTYPLIYVLLIALATNTKLDKYSNIEKIVRILKNKKEEDWFGLLSTFTQTEKDVGSFAKWGEDHPDFRGHLQLGKFTSWLSRKLGISSEDDKMPIEQRNLAINTDHDPIESTGLFNILKLVKGSLDDLALMFKFVLNPDMLRQQIGLDLSNNTMEKTVVQLSSNQYQIFNSMHNQFMSLVAVPGSVFLSSVFNTLYPIPQVGGGGQFTTNRLNFLELKEKNFDAGLNKTIQSLIFDTFVSEIKNSIGQYSPSEAQEKTGLIVRMCKDLNNIVVELDAMIKSFFANNGENTIRTVNFSLDELDRFTSSIHDFASQFLSQNKRFENVFSQIVRNGMPILKIAQTRIYESIENFMRDITGVPNYVSSMTHLHGVNAQEVQSTYIPQMTDTLFVIFYSFFLYTLQSALCEYIKILDVEMESKVNDVIDFPNYTLVITTDVLKAVYTAQLASGLQKLISGDQMYHVGKMTQNNIKGMLKVIRTKLAIPSIIVYDDRMNEYYYQFMFMSTPEKISGPSLDSFVKSNNANKY